MADDGRGMACPFDARGIAGAWLEASRNCMNPLIAQLRPALYPLHAPPWTEIWPTDLDDALPPRLRDAVVLLGLVPRASGVHVLFTRRAAHLRHHAGEVSFPGGAIESDDAGPVAAAVRETGEETGIAAQHITALGFLNPMFTFTGYRVLPVVAEIDPACQARPDPNEVAEVFELPLAHLLAEGVLDYRPMSLRGRIRHIAELSPLPGQAHPRIWGATAVIIDILRQRQKTLAPELSHAVLAHVD